MMDFWEWKERGYDMKGGYGQGIRPREEET